MGSPFFCAPLHSVVALPDANARAKNPAKFLRSAVLLLLWFAYFHSLYYYNIVE